MNQPLDAGERIVFCLIASALACILLTLACGAFSILFYFPGAASALQSIGIEFQFLRPLHTTFASAWIFLGGITCVYKFLFDTFGQPTSGDKRRFKFQMVCWGIAGLGILTTVPFGWTSGREYIGFHPIFSLFIVAGWLAFATTFFLKVHKQFWSRPVYVYMWATGILYFLYTFAEGHAYLLPQVGDRPIVDLQIQWKSCGTIVASFNMLVYGTLMYLAEMISGDRKYAQSTKGFALMGVGLLNSFTNYAHHTYHIPQSELVVWISFLVSMSEIIILFSVFNDVAASLAKRKPSDQFETATHFIDLARNWTLALLFVAILISIPPLNSVIHGTYVVMAHAMTSEIGIDSFILFALIAYLLSNTFTRCWTTQEKLVNEKTQRTIKYLNRSLIGLFSWLLTVGTITGLTRASSIPTPEWITQYTPLVLAITGGMLAYNLLMLVHRWVPLLIQPSKRRLYEQDRPPE